MRATFFTDNVGTIADRCSGVLSDIVFKSPLVIIDEQAGGREICQTLLQEQELDHSSPGIAGAGAELALVVDAGTMRSKIDHCRQGRGLDPGTVHREVLTG